MEAQHAVQVAHSATIVTGSRPHVVWWLLLMTILTAGLSEHGCPQTCTSVIYHKKHTMPLYLIWTEQKHGSENNQCAHEWVNMLMFRSSTTPRESDKLDSVQLLLLVEANSQVMSSQGWKPKVDPNRQTDRKQPGSQTWSQAGTNRSTRGKKWPSSKWVEGKQESGEIDESRIQGSGCVAENKGQGQKQTVFKADFNW